MTHTSKTKTILISPILSTVGRIAPITLSKILFRVKQHKKLNLKNPQDFNEKLMWLKINNYNNNPTVWKCADKYLVRKYAVEHGVPEENLPKLIGTYKNADDINFNKLPNKFVLKCSHGCGFNIICKDKTTLNIKKTKRQLNKWLKTKFGYASAEPHYTHIKPVIICEEFIENSATDGWPYDYKLHCFNGEPKAILVISNRESGNLKRNWYTVDWKKLDYGYEKNQNKNNIEKPNHLKQMMEIAKKVSQNFPYVRVDFYEYQGKAILGEMTFTPAACLSNNYSQKGLQELGNMLQLDTSNSKTKVK